MTVPALNLWKGKTVHARYVPFERRFAYDLALMDIDIDRLDEADRQSALFSVERPNLFSFSRNDHGARDGLPLRPWAEQMLYKFAPISLWYGYGPSGDLRGIIYEVNNTFGDTHAYVAAASGNRSQHEAGKAFHVSPFFDVTGTYRFTLRAPDDRLSVVVESLKDGARLHMANIIVRRQPATARTLLATALSRPVSSLGVTLGIHWQALKIWLRGATYHPRPTPPEQAATVAIESPVEDQHIKKDAA